MMIPECITQDLRAGLSLEDTLIKHGTNLKELFKCNSIKNSSLKKPQRLITEWTWIRRTKYDSFIVSKGIEGKSNVNFGTYKTHADARCIRDELIKCDWDKNRLEDIQKKLGIIPNKQGGSRK